MTAPGARALLLPTLVPPAPRLRALLLLALALPALVLVGCGGASGPGAPGPTPPPPALAGARVMLLPAQVGSPAQLDAELAFWLADRAPHTTWLLPDHLQRTVDRSPAWRVRLDALPRPLTDTGGGKLRVADPLYGALRRLGAVEDTNVALVPVHVRPVPGADGAPGGADAALELTAAVVDIRGGRVVWLGTVRGAPGASRGAAVAAAAEALARALVPR